MPYTDPCMGPTGVGVLDSQGKLTQAARDAFTSQVITLLVSGNRDGKGAKISSLLGIPFPPEAGFGLPDPDRIITNPGESIVGDLFRFDPSPFAPLTFDTLRDPKQLYQKLIIDNLYQPFMQAVNQKGNAVAPPILDYSGFLPPDIAIKLTLPDLPKIAIAFPGGLLALKALNLDLGSVPSFIANLSAVIPIPSIPSIPQFSLPDFPTFDFVIFPQLFSLIVQLPFVVLPDLIAKLSASPIDLLIPTPPALFKLVLDVVFGLVLDILKKLGLLVMMPKLLIATIIVFLQNAVAAIAPLAVSQIIGTGLVVKTIGQALGLA